MKKLTLVFISLLVIVLAACSGTAQSEKDKKIETITFADPGWDSVRVHNQIAATIIENGYGYDTEVTAGSTPATVQGLRQGDINAYMELWVDNIEKLYNEALDQGDIVETSVNFDDNEQGYYVPTYVIKGDKERGIDPIAPDLKSVEDLKKYPEVFKDPEQPEKARIYGAPSGWAVDEILAQKVETYGLDTYNYFRPGSGAALATSLADAYESGEAWVGYYWSPTWVTSVYDLTLLEEPEYNKEQYQENYGTEIPSMRVTTAVHKDLPEQAPEVVTFLKQYETSNALTQSALEYMKKNGTNAEETAQWWMKDHEDVWTEWVPEEVVSKVKEAL